MRAKIWQRRITRLGVENDMDFDIFFLGERGIDELLELHDAVARELGDAATDLAYADLIFSVLKNDIPEHLSGTQITRIESHHDPRLLLAIIERDGEETVRIAFGSQNARKVTSAMISMLADEYQKNPQKEHLKIYFKRKLMHDMKI